MEGAGRRVLLASMPFSSPHYPNLALGLLKPLVEAGGAACDVRYFSLDHLDALGAEAYALLTEPRLYMAQAGEWVFAPLAHPQLDPDDPAFLTDVLLRHHPDAYRPALLDALLAARDGAGAFVAQCLNAVDWDRYAIVGFTTSFQQTNASLALARRIKARHPQVKVVLGGANCQDTMGLELLAQHPFVDAICLGEGEHALPELVRRCLAGEALDGIPGMAVRGAAAPLPAQRTQMEALPYPDFDDFFTQRSTCSAAEAFPPAVVFETARGCWWGAKQHCTFCGLNGTGMAFRSKSAGRAYAELEHLVRRYGYADVANADNILDMAYFQDFLPRLAQSNAEQGFAGAARDQLLIYYEVKANLRPEQVSLLARAGVRKIQPGIEALDTPLLKLMRKGVTAIANVQLLKLAAEEGIYVEWLALCGFPGEDPDSYARQAALIPMLRHLQPPAAFLRARADRFSPYHAAPAEHGVSLEPLPAYRYIYGCDAAAQARLGYHFTMRSDELDRAEQYHAPAGREYAAWQACQPRSALWLEDAGDAPVVHDRRWGWPAADESLGPAEAAVVRSAACAVSWAQVVTQNSRALGPAELDAAADRLAARGWIVREGRQVLALPLRDLPGRPGFRAAPSIDMIRHHLSLPGKMPHLPNPMAA